MRWVTAPCKAPNAIVVRYQTTIIGTTVVCQDVAARSCFTFLLIANGLELRKTGERQSKAALHNSLPLPS